MLETRAAAIKAMATWHATHTVQECREACGGLGYLTVNRFAALKADSDVFTTFEGDNLVLRQLVAKNLLTDFRDELGELDPLGTVAFYAGQVFEVFAERTAVRELVGRVADDLLPFRGDEPDLLDRDHQLHLFQWREDHMRGAAARRLQSGMSGGGDPFRVLVDTQDHVVDVARVHTEKIVLESFARAVEAAEDADRQGRARPALQPLRPVARRARPRLVPGAREAVLDGVEGGHQGRQPPVRGAAPGRRRPRRGVRRPGQPAPGPSKPTGCARTMSA